ncbi:UrcA family protein [Rhizomicrobium palustre]|uniref:UrcA family protein n=1 Tax=Rhizomicrobium palustre TaxID=189966 RepID=A0A846MUQ0_9PROT|nr:UrcA family protein [Rhizomicrobium palustre]NIK87238.1 UrcA family protein [Rhizomicrobium palustre]
MHRSMIAAGLALAALAGTAFAAGTSVEVSGLTPTLGGDKVKKLVVVKYDDLNPNDKQGAQALFTRLNLVATALCSSNPGGKGSLLAEKVEKCRSETVVQAAKDIGAAELIAISK